jgi:hypothetical protein
VDVDLEAKDLLARLAPQTGSRVVEAYRDLRADLAQRPTMTEVDPICWTVGGPV